MKSLIWPLWGHNQSFIHSVINASWGSGWKVKETDNGFDFFKGEKYKGAGVFKNIMMSSQSVTSELDTSVKIPAWSLTSYKNSLRSHLLYA